MHISRLRSGRWWATIGTTRAKKLEASFDVWVTWIQLRCPLVGVQGISDLVVARLVLHAELVISYTYEKSRLSLKTYQSAEIVPDLRNVRVQANSPRVRVQSISVLVDLVIQDTDGAPKSGILPIAIHSLLVGFICFWILLL